MSALAILRSDDLATSAGQSLSVARPQPELHDFHGGNGLWLAHTQARPVQLKAEPVPIQSLQDLVVQLGAMPVDVAAPLLRSPLPSLDVPALLALIAATGEAHHRLIARRAGLDRRVVKALIRSNSDDVLQALAENHDLSFEPEEQGALARLAGDRPGLRAAILSNPALPLAQAQLGGRSVDRIDHRNLLLVRYLRAGQAAKFVVEAARRFDCEATQLQRALMGPSAAPFALMCCALSLDRAVFLDLLPRWQAAGMGDICCNDAHMPLVLTVFSLRPEDARRKLAAIMAQR